RETLVLASAATRPDLTLLATAAGPGAARDLEAAEALGVVALGPDGHVEFEHDLVRAVIYAEAGGTQRRAAHAALAAAVAEPVERARHRALADPSQDERVARELTDAAAAGGKWVSTKSSTGKDLGISVGSFASYSGYVSRLTATGGDGLANGATAAGTTTYQGQSVAVYKTADKSTFYVAASGAAYVLEVVPGDAKTSIAVTLTWNQPTTVTAPPASQIYNG
ncbi:MAG: hypothetical protein ACRDVE_14180, partial [Actinocrinis sp.]